MWTRIYQFFYRFSYILLYSVYRHKTVERYSCLRHQIQGKFSQKFTLIFPSNWLLWRYFAIKFQYSYVFTSSDAKCTRNPLKLHWFNYTNKNESWFQWPCGLRRRSAAVRFLGLGVRIPSRARIYISLSRECCVFSSRGFWESYWAWYVLVWFRKRSS